MSIITLTASSDYNTAGKQFVARITGRRPKFTFEREFVGQRSGKRKDYTSADVDEPGLYETRDTTRKGTDDSYCIVWQDEDRLVKTDVDRDVAMKLAKNLPSDWSACGRPLAIAELESLVQQGKEKDPEGLLTVKFYCGIYTAGDVVKRADLIAACEAEIVRLRAQS